MSEITTQYAVRWRLPVLGIARRWGFSEGCKGDPASSRPIADSPLIVRNLEKRLAADGPSASVSAVMVADLAGLGNLPTKNNPIIGAFVNQSVEQQQPLRWELKMVDEMDSTSVENDMSRTANYVKVAPIFAERFGRLPLPPYDPAASINDLIFLRSIEPRWSPLERALVDKSTAKAQIARLSPSLRTPRTLATIAMDAVRSPTELFALLAPFVGTDAIAKPAQASGGALFLRAVPTPRHVAELYSLATSDYSLVMREMQYAGLPRRIIVETLVPTINGAPPDDFKFHCIRGEPLLCQVDHARFGPAWSRVLRLPDLAPLDPADGLTPPASLVMPGPDRVTTMIATARALAAPFVYARIDLYDGVDGVYFGEVTFTPAASLGIAPSAAGCHRETETHRIYSRTLMDAFRRDSCNAGQLV